MKVLSLKLSYSLSLFIITLFLWMGGVRAPMLAQAQTGAQLKLVSADERSLVLELTVADFQVETVEWAGQMYHKIIIGETVQTTTPGEPQVPTLGTLLGLPTTEGVEVRVLETNSEMLSGYRLLPAPGLVVRGEDPLQAEVQPVFTLDQRRYALDAFFPDQPAQLGQVGLMRDQAVAQVQFYPVQYNPVKGEVRLYRRLVVQVTWEARPPGVTKTTGKASPAYEELLRQSLLNYKLLERPAVAEGTLPPSTAEKGLISVRNAPQQLKIGVVKDGLYRLTPAHLSGNGFNLAGVSLSTLKLKNREVEIPLFVFDENANDNFDGNDYLLFYGTAIAGDAYTIKNIYWLEAGGAPGRRMSSRPGTLSGSTPVPAHFPVTLHKEEESYYWSNMPEGEGQDHWFWGDRLSAPVSKSFTLTLGNIATSGGTTTVRVSLKGATNAGQDPDHHTRLYLNGVKIDDRQWNGFSSYNHQVVVPHSYLKEGNNTLAVASVGDTGAVVDSLFVNWLELDYRDTYKAEGDQLLFGAPAAGTYQFEVTNFSQSQIQLFEVTDPQNVVRITDTTVVGSGANYRLKFKDNVQLTVRYLALTPAQYNLPATIELDQPSAWQSSDHGADYVIITARDFYTSALKLAEQRNAAGLRVATVKVEDLYDEFNFGLFSPQAIQNFLTYAYAHWAEPAPTYVLLLGGASYDYRDLLRLARKNYVPTQLIETNLLGQAPSDYRFALVSGSDLWPDLFIGRLTAQNPTEAAAMVNKIIGYEQNPPEDPWNRQVLLVADDGSPAFEAISEVLAGRLPLDYEVRRVDIDTYPPGDPTLDIVNTFDGGSILVNYAGHGSKDGWGSWSGGKIFSRNNVNQLSNADRLPVVTIGNCLNGYFVGAQPSLAEAFLQPQDKGAAAVWAASSVGYSSGHQILLQEFYEAIFQEGQYALGAATTAAKIKTLSQNSYWQEMVETFVLFGDPVMQVGIPLTAVTGVTLEGPDQGAVNKQYTFKATVEPPTATLPIAYEWQATGQVPILHKGKGLEDTAAFTWDTSGPQTVSVTATNIKGTVIGTRTITILPFAVEISGPVKGNIDTPYLFEANVNPITATRPITYTWWATGQPPITRTLETLNDSLAFSWSTPGTQAITVTAANVENVSTDTHLITINIPITAEIVGPITGTIDTPYTFEARVRPITATRPITYIWRTATQAPATHTVNVLNNTTVFTWSSPGTQVVTVTVINAGNEVVDTHLITISTPSLTKSTVYLPVIVRN